MRFRKYCIFLFVLVFGFISNVSATNYYVNPSSTAILENGTFDFPWKSLSQVNSKIFQPGDSILFKRNQNFFGTLICSNSGIESNPIVYTTYGIGDRPSFTNSVSDVIKITNQKYIVIDNFKIIDNTMDLFDHSKTAKISYAIVLNNSSNCTIQNCDISLVGVGIQLLNGSNFTTISKNYIHNLRIVRNTLGGDDDYGANAMVIGTSNNTIQYNTFEECWAYCYDYGHDGGAIEYFGQAMNNNIVMYNVAIECDGFLEVGSNTYGLSTDNLIAYNKIINCGLLGAFHNNSIFNVNIHNIYFYNNDIIETKFLFSNTLNLFWLGDYLKQGVVYLKNNILWLISGIDIVPASFNSVFLIHSNNIYRQKNGDLGVQLDSTELLLSDSVANFVFVDTSGLPKYWNYHLKSQSPAIDFGINVGLNKDFEGNKIINVPDAGIYEYILDTATTIKILFNADSILCNGGTTILHVKAISGTPPYIGVGDFEVYAGKYVFTVFDALGKKNVSTIYIGEPSKITISTLQNIDTRPTGNNSILITAAGGIPPYQFKIDLGEYQINNTFYQLTEGDHIISVKDVNNCIATQIIHIIDITTTNVSNNKLLIRVGPNPSTTYFTLSPIKYKNNVYVMTIKVYSLSSGYVLFSTQTLSNNSVTFGANFFPGSYLLVVEVAGTTQAVQLLKL